MQKKNAENSVSDLLDFKIFWGIPLEPPRGLCLMAIADDASSMPKVRLLPFIILNDMVSLTIWFLSISIAELELDRYKFIVQVVIGEQRGEGVK